MDHTFSEVIRLLRLAQTGEREQALALADERLRGGESAGILYARAVTLHSIGDHEASVQAAERILDLTGGMGTPGQPEVAGWRAIALAFRAWEQMLLSEANGQVYDLESMLHDLGQAEAILSHDVSHGFLLATAHTCLGNGYHELRLYELARPNFEAAFAAATTPDDLVVDRAVTSQLNLATMHLNWSMELHRIRDSAGALEKGIIAAGHAAMALKYADTDETRAYASHAALLLACADSIRSDGDEVVARIRDALTVLQGRGLRESPSYALPFLALALDRTGRTTEALQVAQEAIDALPEDATWMVASAAYHAHAMLLSESGSDSAHAALAYGDQLAETMWRQRLRTLHNARSVQVLERVTMERDRIQVLAHTDTLTGVGNRRAFNVRVAELNQSLGDTEVAMIVVDVDRLKAVNDAGGHEAGDRTLQAVAAALVAVVRASDLVARLGGDEFVAVVEAMDRVHAAALASRMIDAISAALGSSVTVSIGVATGPAAQAGTDLLHAADRAMYRVKRARRAVGTSESEWTDVGRSRTG